MRSILNKVRYGGARLALAGGAVLAMAQSAMAQYSEFEAGGQPIEEIPISGRTLPEMVNQIISIILIVVGVLAVVYLIYGGIQYVTAGGDAEKATKGRTTITNAIIGIILIVASWAIYSFIIRDFGVI